MVILNTEMKRASNYCSRSCAQSMFTVNVFSQKRLHWHTAPTVTHLACVGVCFGTLVLRSHPAGFYEILISSSWLTLQSRVFTRNEISCRKNELVSCHCGWTRISLKAWHTHTHIPSWGRSCEMMFLLSLYQMEKTRMMKALQWRRKRENNVETCFWRQVWELGVFYIWSCEKCLFLFSVLLTW